MKLNFLLLIIISFLNSQAQSVLKTMKRLPGTGQTTSYTTTFGEDNDYNFNPPFYVLNNNGTVTDTVTGLQWQQTDGGEMTIENAATYCDTLTLGGFTDWRLPDCHELFSILNHDKTNPAINTTYFTNTGAEYWWSSQKQANDATKVWCTNAGGGVGNHPKTETKSAGGTKKFHVRAVRDINPPISITNHFINNGDGTITDMLTNLIWKQMPSTDSITWEQALTDAENLNFAGHDDWRMPDIKELQSINEERYINPSVNTTFFTGIKTAFYWSSTSLPNFTAKAWYLDTRYGITTYANKTSKNYLLCVRNAVTANGLNATTSHGFRFEIYPNPSKGDFHMIQNKTIDQIIITNYLGQEIVRAAPNSNEYSLNICQPGIYFVTVIEGGIKLTEKIIIE